MTSPSEPDEDPGQQWADQDGQYTKDLYSSRLLTGGSFIYDAPETVPAIWGSGDDVLWAEGEPLIITGPTGVGKTTLGGQVVAARLGLIPDVISFPVKPGKRVLYLAMDRPAQIQRALARNLRHHPRDILDDKLVVWKGPPPADLGRHPTVLRALANEADADTVIIDSLKDAAVKLSDEETGQGIARAMNYCVSDGVEVMVYHHQRKAGGGDKGSKPNSLADMYGSTFISASVGSVILLWGSAGDHIVELSHMKQPASDVGPLKLVHDHAAGTTTLFENVKLEDLLTTPRTTREIAMLLSASDEPVTRNELAKVTRRLETAVKAGAVVKVPKPPNAPKTDENTWVAGSFTSFTNSFTHPSSARPFTLITDASRSS